MEIYVDWIGSPDVLDNGKGLSAMIPAQYYGLFRENEKNFKVTCCTLYIFLTYTTEFLRGNPASKASIFPNVICAICVNASSVKKPW